MVSVARIGQKGDAKETNSVGHSASSGMLFKQPSISALFLWKAA